MAGNVVCSHCESVIPADSKFCPNCGAEYEPEEPVSQFNSVPPQSPQPVRPPQPPPFTQALVQPVIPTKVTEPGKSKRNTYIIFAVVAVVLLCVCIIGIFIISSLSGG